jgi:CheY-like chemotaxis protein
MDGLTCTRQIRALEHQGLLESRVPVIATTANARPAQVQMAMEAGVVSDSGKKSYLLVIRMLTIARSGRLPGEALYSSGYH